MSHPMTRLSDRLGWNEFNFHSFAPSVCLVDILQGQPRRMEAPNGAPVAPPSTISSRETVQVSATGRFPSKVRLCLIRPDRSGDLSVFPPSLKLDQYFAAAIRFQRLPECFLELVERVHMLHCGGERSISYEVSELLVYLFDLCARRVAYPIDEPESVEAKTTVDELFGRHSWELPTLKAVHDNRAARFKRFGQLAHGRSTHRIEDEAKFLPVESLLNILV